MLLILTASNLAQADACTDGSTCYCDVVSDPNLLWCEDWEAVNLHDDVRFGDGAPNYGPPYDHTGGKRGQNSYWHQVYGLATGASCSWTEGDAPSPTYGIPCAAGSPGGVTCSVATYHVDDDWDGNAVACMSWTRAGEYDDEIAGNAEPTVPSKHSGPFDGQQSWTVRVREGNTAAILGNIELGVFYTTIGVAQALAYPTNIETSLIFDYPWKHQHWYGAELDAPFIYHTANGWNESVPFNSHITHTSTPACSAAAAGANVRLADIESPCTGSKMDFTPPQPHYRQSVDFPVATWGCVQGWYQNMGSANSVVQIAMNGNMVIDFTFDGTDMRNPNGWDQVQFNAYANINQEPPRSTAETTFRYEDNFHLTTGMPPSCADLGFHASTPEPSWLDCSSCPSCSNDCFTSGSGGGVVPSISGASISGGSINAP